MNKIENTKYIIQGVIHSYFATNFMYYIQLLFQCSPLFRSHYIFPQVKNQSFSRCIVFNIASSALFHLQQSHLCHFKRAGMGHPGDSEAHSESSAELGTSRRQMLCMSLLVLFSTVAGQQKLRRRSNFSLPLGHLSVNNNIFKTDLIILEYNY